MCCHPTSAHWASRQISCGAYLDATSTLARKEMCASRSRMPAGIVRSRIYSRNSAISRVVTASCSSKTVVGNLGQELREFDSCHHRLHEIGRAAESALVSAAEQVARTLRRLVVARERDTLALDRFDHPAWHAHAMKPRRLDAQEDEDDAGKRQSFPLPTVPGATLDLRWEESSSSSHLPMDRCSIQAPRSGCDEARRPNCGLRE